jgi:T5SS/PEP-CTERM-associated repeat protein
VLGLIFALLVASTVQAVNITWKPTTQTDGQYLWSDSTNWSTGTVPLTTDAALFNVASTAVINSSETVSNVFIGYATGGSVGNLTVANGGNLTVLTGLLDIGRNGTGTLTVDPGAVITVSASSGIYLGHYAAGNGTFIMNGGDVTTTKLMLGYTSGAVISLQLLGGTLNAASWDFSKAGITRQLLVGEGTIKVSGDGTATIATQIANGVITATTGRTLAYDYDITTPGKTTLYSVIPEPATISMLVIGTGLIFRKRSK